MRKTTASRERALQAFPALEGIAEELNIYAHLLCRWQARINLVSRNTLDDLWWRHFADSLQVWKAAPDARRWVDLGSGAGFPGMVVALAGRNSGVSVTLVESDHRKAAFLREVSRETSAVVTVETRRAEDIIEADSPPEMVTSRALAPLPTLAKLIHPWLEKGTAGVFLTGEQVLTTDIPAEINVRMIPSRTGPGFVVSVKHRDSRLA